MDNQITASTFTNFGTAISVGSQCLHTIITSPDYSGGTTHLSDSGMNTQTVGPYPEVPNMASPGQGSSVVQYFSAGATVTAGNLQCFSSTSNTVVDCGASPTNFLGVALAPANSVVPVQIQGLATVNLDASSTVTPGDYICTSTTAGETKENGTTLCTGPQVGIAAASASASTTASVFLQRH